MEGTILNKNNCLIILQEARRKLEEAEIWKMLPYIPVYEKDEEIIRKKLWNDYFDKFCFVIKNLW